ncbi:ATP-binding protein [Pseudofrankia inefficax]|uniref:ATP-binding region ATPase domain protein n=1 Tax=Pseudofrankia inefficax (strain DSM 45817 / CECT 9037 / DDB 130130 / EuI1c) TaxID=298654 RepID=E3JBQ6_PSEI1|nr:ATP-binding protein [Pseudofrankia inefficax]ADP81076.1 ATP-binding region ATPase domain protein [Pseudofrankia inefficax]
MTSGQTGPPAAPHVAVFRFPADPAACPLARHFVRGVLGEWRLAQAADVAELLTSELVGNAIDACAGAERFDGGLVGCVEVGVTADRDRLLIEVADADPRPPTPRDPGPDDESGRGLMLVEGLAERWGHHLATDGGRPHGKVVWFEIALASAAAPVGLPIRLPTPRVGPEQAESSPHPRSGLALPDLALLGRVRRRLDLV